MSFLHSSLFHTLLLLLVFCSLSWTAAIQARGAEYVVTPSLSLRETYDDNVFLRGVDDFEHRISPEVTLGARSETAEAEADIALDISDYQENNELDSVDEYYRLSTSLLPTSTLRLGLYGSYIRDYTFRSALEEGIVAERSRRKTATVQPSLNIAVTDRNTIDLLYGYNNTQYNFQDYPDYAYHYFNVGWYHALANERTTAILEVGGSRADFDLEIKDGTQQGLSGVVGFDHALTETLQVALKGGVRYTESKYPTEKCVTSLGPLCLETKTVKDKDTDITYLFFGNLVWNLERLRMSAEASRDVVPSLYGEEISRDRISATVRYRITENLSCRLHGRYARSETEGRIRKQKSKTFFVRPSLGYRFGEHVGLMFAYDFTRSDNEITDRIRHRNRVYLELRVDWETRY
jgi:hypothetical protein